VHAAAQPQSVREAREQLPMARRSTTGPLVISLFLLAACESGESTQPEVTVRDSVGITIVDNHAPAWHASEAWRIADSVTLQLGQADGPAEYTFTYPIAAQLSDGRILVSDAGFKELRFYRSDGQYLQTVGGEGPGPGEFTWLSATFVLPGDTLVATDDAPGRVTIFDEYGALVETVQLESRGNQTSVAGPLATRLWVATASFPAPDSAGLSGRLQEIAVYGSDGSVSAVIDTLTLSRRTTRQGDAGVLMTVLPFGPRPAVAASGGKAYVAPGDRYEIRVYDADGTLRRIIRRDWEPEAVTEEDVSEHLEHVKELFSRFDTPTSTRAAFLEMNESAARLSSVKPPIRAVATDRQGYLWVQPWVAGWRTVGNLPATPHDVFDPDGRWLGQVEVPAGHWVTDIGADYVWTMWSDDLDVNYARRLPLFKPSP